MAALLIDIGCLCDAHSDAALEFMAKAVGEDPPGDDIWAAHPNPFVRRIVEMFTDRGLERIEGVRAELSEWLTGMMHKPVMERPPRPIGSMSRWTLDELAGAKIYLQALPPSQFTLDDWMLLVDYLVQRYLPTDDVRAEASWLATRSNIMGRVQAAMGDASEPLIDAVLARWAEADAPPMSVDQQAALDFGRVRCCEHVTGLTDALRQRWRNLIVDYQEAQFLRDPAQRQALQSKLFDTFGDANRDWRRIAVTEATENVNQGFIATMPYGVRVQRVEKYRGACPFCRKIDGIIMTVVDPAKPDKDGQTEVWLGKTNVGRSASSRKRVGGQLWEREAHEMWWPAAGAQHPHCRGAWVKVTENVSADPVFDEWLASLKKSRSAS